MTGKKFLKIAKQSCVWRGHLKTCMFLRRPWTDSTQMTMTTFNMRGGVTRAKRAIKKTALLALSNPKVNNGWCPMSIEFIFVEAVGDMHKKASGDKTRTAMALELKQAPALSGRWG